MASQAKREQLLDAALDVLGSGERLTYDVVAARAQASRQTLYRYFPTRPELLVAIADRARQLAGADDARDAIYGAPTAVEALRALLAFHARFVPALLPAHLAVERERSVDPDLDAAFRRRTAGRRQLAQLVASRLAAEGVLAAPWTASTAAEVIHSMTSAATTARFLHDEGWSVEELAERLLLILERSLLNPTTTAPEDP